MLQFHYFLTILLQVTRSQDITTAGEDGYLCAP